ncbi:MAG TPA: hypothetical protein DCF68_17245 [Cyanothece sp. UBA12306]|nr:hypothetical protein [Cyanothece sp. UBA12306]
MNTKEIEIKLSEHHLSFQPGKEPVYFEIYVINLSHQFASFQVILEAAGSDKNTIVDWYTLTPDISSKIPPGGTVTFFVTIQKNPIPGFVGSLDILVKLLSVELEKNEHRDVLQLTLTPGIEESSLFIKLLNNRFKNYPGETLNIPVQIEHNGVYPVNIIATLMGLNATWLIEGASQHLQLPPQSHKQVIFKCQLPSDNNVISQVYPFIIRVESEENQPKEVTGNLEVLPTGEVIFEVTPKKQTIPQKFPWIPNFKVRETTYILKFYNKSNLKQLMSASLINSDTLPQQWHTINPSLPTMSLLVCEIYLKLWQKNSIAASLFLKENHFIAVETNQTKQLELNLKIKRHWLGRIKTLFFSVSALNSDQRIDIQNNTQLLKLVIHPKIPLWLAGVASFLLLFLWYWLSCFNPYSPRCGHQAPINSLQFNGRGLNAISGSDDQTIIEWNLEGFGWQKLFINPIFSPIINIGKTDKSKSKSVRVVRYQPFQNNVIAAGLENGEIELWDLLNDRHCPRSRLIDDAANRVLDMTFSPDSQFLYASYGSGHIRKWKLNLNTNNSLDCNPISTTSSKEKKFNFAIYSLVFVGDNHNLLALGGQYNKLCLIDNQLTDTSCDEIGQIKGGDQDYIHDIAIAENKPTRIVTADNRGRIQGWDLADNNCLNDLAKCQTIKPRDQWNENPDHSSPVYSLALSKNGCYLVSGGENGKVLLWILNANGSRAFPQPKLIYPSPKSINSVDVKVINQKIHILSGGDETKVHRNIYTFKRSECE